ncbi:MAG: two-component system sensor histidine kinase KdbD, partial [Undibacterium sp.]|nr:two-component system sensor histidine kinase KdbD [Undibacterium sp.]
MAINNDQRPDPDVLLAHVQAQERRATRGKLRIYFGASAGVGKTYAMLTAARKLIADGQPVLVGVIETHGRDETAALVEGLDVLPPKQIPYRDKTIAEFDIDSALERKPKLILMDELAHSNAPGSRHPKRWQDVEELLDAGIDVYTTVNVQHLESLNDVVGGITGIRVAETLPDTVFDEADEVVLVDIPADELLARLKSGRVYQVQQAERAAKNFFRKGNLIALRELALRRTADRVEDDVQAYRIEKSISAVWKTDASMLACVGPHPGADHLIRSAARLAGQMNTVWHAIYIETPTLQKLPAAQRERILKSLKLAQDLGANTAVLFSNDIALAIVEYASGQNFSRIVMGRKSLKLPWHISHRQRVTALAPHVDLIEIGRAASQDDEGQQGLSASETTKSTGMQEKRVSSRTPHRLMGYVFAA